MTTKRETVGRLTAQMSAKDGDDDIGRGYCVRPFPFVGPRRPPQTVGYAGFDRWEDSFAYCAGNQVRRSALFFFRCLDECSGLECR